MVFEDPGVEKVVVRSKLDVVRKKIFEIILGKT